MIKHTVQYFARDTWWRVRTFEGILLRHLDGGLVPMPDHHTTARQATNVLCDRRWLDRVEKEIENYGRVYTVRLTKINDLGRDMLARLLADHAERLVAAHLAEIDAAAYKAANGQTESPTPDDATVACRCGDPLAHQQDQTLPTERADAL